MMSRGHAVIPFHNPHKKSMRSLPVRTWPPCGGKRTIRPPRNRSGDGQRSAAGGPRRQPPQSRSGALLLGLLALLAAEDVLSQAHRLRRHLDELVVGDPFERALEGDRARHLEAGVDLFGRLPVVAELLALGGVAEHVVGA